MSDLDALKERLDKDEIFSQQLKTGVAYHSPVMHEVASEYLSLLGSLNRAELETDGTDLMMISSVTGQRVSANTLANGQYWVDNLTSPVRFSDALQYIAEAAPKVDKLGSITDFVEVGPHGALRRPLSDTLKETAPGTNYRYMSMLSRFESPLKSTLNLVGELFMYGYPITIAAANAPDPGLSDPGFTLGTPQYPFDHSKSYWHETRFSKEWRLRKDVPRSLLGTQAMDWNPLEPRWRRQLSIENTPWIADHAVGGNFFFPATGTIMMALGAVKQMSDNDRVLRAYNIKECTFMNPIVIRPEGKVEVMVHLHPLRKSYEKAAVRFQVQILAMMDTYWTECFKATCHVEYEDSSHEVDGGHEFCTASATFAHEYVQVRDTSRNHISKADFYQWHTSQGIEYGKTFSLARDIRWDGNHAAVGSVDIDSTSEGFEGVIHPAILDAAFQVGFTSPSCGMSKTLPTFIPHRMIDIWISANGWQQLRTSQIQTLAVSKLKSIENCIEGSLTVLSDDLSLLCHVRNFELLPVMNNESNTEATTKQVYTIDWKPHLSLLTPRQLRGHCGGENIANDESATVDYCTRLEKSLRLAVRLALNRLQEIDQSGSPLYMRKYVSLMQSLCPREEGPTSEESKGDRLSQELKFLKEENPSWRLFIDVAQNFLSILNGDREAVDSLMPAAQELVEEFQRRTADHKLVSYLELLAHQTPNQKILELGAGSGVLTTIILSALQRIEEQTGGNALSEYVFTDTTSDGFDSAQQCFANQKGRMSFKVADLDQDLTGQGISSGTYDVVIVSKPLHVTRNLAETLNNIRRVLKTGGRLIFYEHTPSEPFKLALAFGVFPGWWLGEEKYRSWCPTTTESGWDTLLRENGFSGNDLVLRDYTDDTAHYASVVVTTAQNLVSDSAERHRALIVVDDNVDRQSSNPMTEALQNELCKSVTHMPKVLSVGQFADEVLEATDCVLYMADWYGADLVEITDTKFKWIQAVLQRSKNLFWISSSTQNPDSDSDSGQGLAPNSGIKDGLLRTLRSEWSDKRVVSLSFDDKCQDVAACANTIFQVFQHAFGQASADVEYIVQDGVVMTGRLKQELTIQREIDISTPPEVVTEAWLPGPPLKLEIGSRGQLETLCYKEDFTYHNELGPTEVEIETRAWAINFRDMFFALGRLDEGEFGSDCAGIVTRVGSSCTTVRPGDRVAMAVFGCMRTYARNEEWAVVPIADSVTFEEACAVMNPGYTAWQCLIEVARLRKGETVLIHSASGATGQLAIQIAQMVGAEVFATVGYDSKKQLLIDLYNIPADHIFYSRDVSFAKGVLRMTDGRGVDVVLNSLFGEGLIASWECVAPYGRFIEIGKADIDANSALPMKHFANNVMFAAVDLRQIIIYRRDMARELFHKTMELAAAGTLHYPKPLNVYDVGAVEDAFRYFQSGKNSGRIVIRVNPAVKVQKHLVQRKVWTFDAAATFVIAGGFGGIGRSILRWMASKGAKYFLVLSRSGPASNAAIEVVKELSGMGVTDSIFEKMTHAQWQSTTRAKVQSSWNLHMLLPDLDFFVLLSSVSGIIGNPGQSNYAAGCTYQDALARYRASHGQRAISIDLGVMRSVGVVAESESLKKRFEDSQGFAQVEEDEFISLLDRCCDPALPMTTSQIAMGLMTPADLLNHSEDPSEMMKQPLYARFSQARDASLNPSSGATLRPGDMFKQLGTAEECASLVVRFLAQKLARALSIQPEDIDTDQPLHAFGVDSLVAVELRNWIAREFAADVAVFEIMRGRTVAAIGELVTRTSQMKLSWKQE
ncbi:hypothetical protein LQW54_003834 [Pestalotiopsis sp. IQ-011]